MTNQPFDPNATQPVPPPATPAQAGTPGPAFQPVAPEPDPAPVKVQPAGHSSGGASRLLNVALGVAVLVAAAGIAFAAGRATAPATAASVVAGGGFGNGTGRLPGDGSFPGRGDDGGGFGPGAGGAGGFGLGGGLSISGTVDSVTGDSVTIRTSSSQTITVGLDGSTTYHQQAAASAADVQAGTTVIVQLADGMRPGQAGNNGNNGSMTLGSAGDITVVP